jgi:hypothetical protein
LEEDQEVIKIYLLLQISLFEKLLVKLRNPCLNYRVRQSLMGENQGAFWDGHVLNVRLFQLSKSLRELFWSTIGCASAKRIAFLLTFQIRHPLQLM